MQRLGSICKMQTVMLNKDHYSWRYKFLCMEHSMRYLLENVHFQYLHVLDFLYTQIKAFMHFTT